MGTLHITEYSKLGRDAESGITYCPTEPALADQAVSTSGTSAQSAAFGADTKIVRLCATTDMHILFGSDPTATTGKQLLKAGIPEYKSVTPGHKVAAIEPS